MSIIPYKRDKRSPKPKNENVSKAMRGNKSKNTKPELLLRKELRNHEIGGYRLHWKKAPGKPDIAYPGRKIAIFVHGCYWHRCPMCNYSLPKHNTDYWTKKFNRNVNRDVQHKKALTSEGWKVFVFWECEVKKTPQIPALKIKNFIGTQTTNHQPSHLKV